MSIKIKGLGANIVQLADDFDSETQTSYAKTKEEIERLFYNPRSFGLAHWTRSCLACLNTMQFFSAIMRCDLVVVARAFCPIFAAASNVATDLRDHLVDGILRQTSRGRFAPSHAPRVCLRICGLSRFISRFHKVVGVVVAFTASWFCWRK